MKKLIFISALLVLNLNAFDLNSAINAAKNVAQSTNTGDYKSLVVSALNASVSELSKNGFLNNAVAKIELPASLKMASELAKKVGGDKWANELTMAINESATKAVGGASEVFLETIKQMKDSDIKSLFLSKDSGFTEFLQKNSTDKLAKVFKPIISDMMSKNSFANAYNGLNSYIKDSKILKSQTASNLKGLASNFGLDSYMPSQNEDLNDYITRKTLDGLFKLMGQKEQALRGGVVNEGSKLLKNILK